MKLDKEILKLLADFDKAVYLNNQPEIERITKELEQVHKKMSKAYPYKGEYTRVTLKNGRTIVSHCNADFLGRKDFLQHIEQWNHIARLQAIKNPKQIYKYYETEVYKTLTGV